MQADDSEDDEEVEYAHEQGRAGVMLTLPLVSHLRLEADGEFKHFEVLEIVADRVDAWNFIPNRPIGAIFLSRQQGDGTSPHRYYLKKSACGALMI